jgi:hypothetical protein
LALIGHSFFGEMSAFGGKADMMMALRNVRIDLRINVRTTRVPFTVRKRNLSLPDAKRRDSRSREIDIQVQQAA